MRVLVIAGIAAALGLLVAVAQGQEAPAPALPTAALRHVAYVHVAYVPDLGDVMETVQLRHFKLSYAGTVKNWPLADYELSQIRKSLREAAKLYPSFANVPMAKLIGEISEPALDRLDAAIKAHDSAAFSQGFSRLTQACNSCHKAAGFGFIVIRVPTASPFSNQSFLPNRD